MASPGTDPLPVDPLPIDVMGENENGPDPSLAFGLGALVATPEAMDAAHHAGVQVVACVLRHLGGDWGDVDAAQAAANRESLAHGGVLRSAYRLGGGAVLVVTTDAGRTLTTAEVGPEVQAD